MSKYHQSDNIHKKHSHKRKFHIGVWTAVGLVLVMIFYLLYDLRIDDGTKLESPGTLSSTEEEAVFTELDEKEFYMKIPDIWNAKKADITDKYDHYSYESSDIEFNARTLDVYIGGFPHRFSTNKIHKVRVDGNRLIPSAISHQCFDEVLAGDEDAVRDITQWSWNGVTFPCNPSSITDMVTAGDDDIILAMTGDSEVTREFTVVYTDHSNKIDNSIFTEALGSFIVK